MSVVSYPFNEPKPEEIMCVLCKRNITLESATIGPMNAKGGVSLFCNGHLWDGLKFIDQHADYLANERQNFFRTNGHSLTQFGASTHVRSLY